MFAYIHALIACFLSLLPFHVDLKPENLLLASKDNDTDVKIADFGFAKHVSEKLNTVCGTPGNPHTHTFSLFQPTNKKKACGVLFLSFMFWFPIVSSVPLTLSYFHSSSSSSSSSLVCVCVFSLTLNKITSLLRFVRCWT
jgi:hypothetical protein